MNPNDTRLPPELRALLADLAEPPAGDDLKARIARGERAFDAVAAHVGDSDPLLADIAEILCGVYAKLGQDEQTEVQLQRMIAVLDRPDAAPSPKLAIAFRRLAAVRMLQEEWDEAVALCHRSLAAFARAGCEEDLEAGRVRLMLGTSYLKQGARAEARSALMDSLPSLGRHPDGHRQLAQAQGLLAQMAMEDDDPGDALSFVVEAMSVLASKPEHANDTVGLGLMAGRCMLDAAQPGSARQLLEAMVATLDQARASDHPLLPRALHLLGEAYLACGDSDLARATYERALAVARTAYGPGSAELAPIHTHLMWSHMVLEDREAALAAAREAVAIYEGLDIDSTRDSRYVDALWSLAERCLEAERFEEAEEIALRLWALEEPVVGPTAPRMGQLLGLRGRIRFERGDHADALPLLEQALEVLKEAEAPADQCLMLARMIAEIRLFHQTPDESAVSALKGVLHALEKATREVEDKNDRRRYGVGLTPRNERS